MAKTVYSNNDVEITIESFDEFEAKVNVNGENLIWISTEDETDFRNELRALLDRYRI
jgi:hypothetical protein